MNDFIKDDSTDTTKMEKAKKLKSKYNALLVLLAGSAEIIVLALIILITVKIFQSDADTESLFKVIGIDLILLWVGALIGYYTWAVYFYNINLGLTHEDWIDIRMRKASGENVTEPTENPNKGNTLGLPEGTIRGTLALTLAVGALAMLIASFGLDNQLPVNKLFIDTFDFFKTGFLMMVAFYFGNKSLQYLNYNASGVKGATNTRAVHHVSESYKEQDQDISFNNAPLVPTKNPEVAAIKRVLNQPIDGPDDIAKADESLDSSDFDKSNAAG